jgi:hypothetical protein
MLGCRRSGIGVAGRTKWREETSRCVCAECMSVFNVMATSLSSGVSTLLLLKATGLCRGQLEHLRGEAGGEFDSLSLCVQVRRPPVLFFSVGCLGQSVSFSSSDRQHALFAITTREQTLPRQLAVLLSSSRPECILPTLISTACLLASVEADPKSPGRWSQALVTVLDSSYFRPAMLSFASLTHSHE